MPSPMQTDSTRSATPSEVAAATSPASHASPISNSKTSTVKASTSRNRENQRLSRARRKEYVASLEARLRDYERKGSTATIEMQKAARNVLRENLQLKEQLARLLCQSCGAKLTVAENGSATGGDSVMHAQVPDGAIESEIRRRGISGFDETDTDRPPSQQLPADLFRDFRPPSAASQPPLRQLVSMTPQEGNYYHRLPSVSSTYSHSSVSSETSHSVHSAPAGIDTRYRVPPVMLPRPVGYGHASTPSTSLPPITQPLQSTGYSVVHSHEAALSPRQFVPRITPDLPAELHHNHQHHQRRGSSGEIDFRNTTDCGDALALLASYGKMELEEISRMICPADSTCCRAKTAVRLAKAVSEAADASRDRGKHFSADRKIAAENLNMLSVGKREQCRVDNRLLFKLLDDASK